MILAQLGLLALASKPKVDTLFFVTSDCPIARRYVPEIKRIMKSFKDVSNFKFMYEDSGVTEARIKAHHKEFNIKSQFVLDSGRTYAKKYEITTVPTAVIKTAQGEVLYKGRIDDAYGTDYKWHQAKSLDLINALKALREGHKVPVKSTPVVGCTLSN